MSDTTISNITRRCVSLANGDLSPDLRVNYEFGLVLGVDEFRQEQQYFLEKEYLHNRALHGYGTVAGLRVTLQPQPNDLQITVGTGMGIDQFGRVFIIRNDQCASLAAWLRKQQATPGAPLPVADAETGVLTLYLVAAYDECLDALVRIAGQPCSSSDQTTAPSRIRDSFNLTLRTAPPPMLEWDAVRRFAKLMAHVEIDPALDPNQSQEAEIIALVRVLDDPTQFDAVNLDLPGEDEPAGTLHTFRIPAQGANAILDRIYTVWVTEVRPRLTPPLIDPQAMLDPTQAANQSAVLLATLRYKLDPASTADNPLIVAATDPLDDSVSNENRPFLLHTQLIQELLLLGNSAEGKPARELATLHVLNATKILVWLHHPADLIADGSAFAVRVNGAEYAFTIPDNAANPFELTTEALIPANARVEVRLDLKAIQVLPAPDQPPAATPLYDLIDTLPYAYIGRDNEFVTVYTFAEHLPTVRDFVTFDTLVKTGEGGDVNAQIQLWVHAPTPITLSADNVTLRMGAAQTPVALAIQPDGGADSPVWVVTIDGRFEDGQLLTFEFDTGKIMAGDHTLTELMQNGQFAYLGYDGATTLTAHYIVEIAAAAAPPAGGLTEEEVKKLIGLVKTLPFVTILPLVKPFEIPEKELHRLQCELWFHVNEPLLNDDELEFFGMVVLSEIDDKLVRLKAEIERIGRNVFLANIVFDQFIPGILSRLRFLFPLTPEVANKHDVDTPMMLVRSPQGDETMPLADFIAKNNIKFDGYSGDGSEFLVAYCRSPVSGHFPG